MDGLLDLLGVGREAGKCSHFCSVEVGGVGSRHLLSGERVGEWVGEWVGNMCEEYVKWDRGV